MSEENTAQSLTKMTPREVRQGIIDCLSVGLVPFVQSSPGMGKSSIIRSVGKQFGLKVIDHRISTSSPVDFSGLPTFEPHPDGGQKATFAPFDLFPTQSTKIPKGFEGWLLFLDEFNSGKQAVQAAAYKLVLDNMIGQHPLHDKVVIAMAGNLGTDRAITEDLSTAMQSRVIHMEMVISHQEWLEDVAYAENYDTRVIAYLNYQSAKLMDFDPNHNEKTFCCPRTWEFVNRIIGPHPGDLDHKLKLLSGTITSGVANTFVTFCKVFQNMPTYRQIIGDPDTMFIPPDPPTRWAVITHLVEKVQEDTFDKVAIYANRFQTDFRILFYRALLVKHPTWRSKPAFSKAMSELSRYLNNR